VTHSNIIQHDAICVWWNGTFHEWLDTGDEQASTSRVNNGKKRLLTRRWNDHYPSTRDLEENKQTTDGFAFASTTPRR